MQLAVALTFTAISVVTGHKYGVSPYYHTIDLMWLQDFSASYEDDLVNLRRELPAIFEDLKSIFPHSKFGLGGFVDKPVGDFGYPESSDYCYELKYRLTRYIDRIALVLENAHAHSGKDWPESQLHAMLGATLSNETKWSALPMTPNGYKIHRLMVVSTDAAYHQAGDSKLEPNNADGVEDCLGEDYPSVEQVKNALDKMHITPIFLVTNEVAAVYRGLVKALDNNGVVFPVKEDSSDIAAAIEKSINLALGNDCATNDEQCSAGCNGVDCCEGAFDCDETQGAAVLIKLDKVPHQIKLSLKQ
eukprot:Gregarina_sp_Poly_1__1685@NODE_1432_length_4160_cov_258_183728_g950_i0_p2_GENE_NODE_1432_length_4160_cov_258_183728_g950_i0NODE_1432_length_4160_cov_258_183728_g950_i0_p2_ORF_typecomplete_len303_score51_90Integrin_beta/PF00362_18/2_2e44IFR3_antag/PF14754_6/0_42_NODE_1432_length_4160_cov_258_183728_g950_i016632571